MIEPSAPHEYERAAALRQATWQLLEDYTHSSREPQDSKIIMGLQDAANRLGAVERGLLEQPRAPRDATCQVARTGALSQREDAAHCEPKPKRTAEAEIVLTLAEVFLPVAASPADEAERWLRIMHGHGAVGEALQQLGMPTKQLSTLSLPPGHGSSPVTAVASEAAHFASQREARALATIDVLFAVMLQYGRLFDRALYAATGKHQSDLLGALVGRQPVAA